MNSWYTVNYFLRVGWLFVPPAPRFLYGTTLYKSLRSAWVVFRSSARFLPATETNTAHGPGKLKLNGTCFCLSSLYDLVNQQVSICFVISHLMRADSLLRCFVFVSSCYVLKDARQNLEQAHIHLRFSQNQVKNKKNFQWVECPTK